MRGPRGSVAVNDEEASVGDVEVAVGYSEAGPEVVGPEAEEEDEDERRRLPIAGKV